jgi:hypothetical protein
MLRDVFIRTYANIPAGIRTEIIVVIDKIPYTWNVAFLEVKNETPLGKKILTKLQKMGLLKDE